MNEPRPSPKALFRGVSVGRELLDNARRGGRFRVAHQPPVDFSAPLEAVPTYAIIPICEYTVKRDDLGRECLVGRYEDEAIDWQLVEVLHR